MFLTALLSCSGAAHAATLQSAEWFLNADPGEGAGTPISGISGSSVATDVTIPAATINALNEGAHLLGLRGQDSEGKWGQTVWRVFYNQHPDGGLAKGEYFFNQDPGLGTGTPLGGVSGIAHADDHTAATSTLPAGANLLGVRLQDGDGEWGQTVFRVFLNPEPGSRVLNRVEFRVLQAESVISSGSVLGDGSLTMNLNHSPTGVTPVLGETLLLEMQVVEDSGRRSHKVFREVTVEEFSQSFLNLFFSSDEQSDPTVSGDDVDADGDGLGNLVEQAMGLHPRQSDAQGAIGISHGPGGMNFSFRSASEAAFDAVSSTFSLGGVQFEVEVSDDITTWNRATSPADFSVSSQSSSQDDGSFRHVIDLANAGSAKRFYRLRVMRQPE